LYSGYKNLFDFCFEENSFDLIQTDEELNFYVDLIKEMNYVSFEKPNINPELAYYDKLERIAKERKKEIVTFKGMVSSVGLFKDNVLDITIYNLHEYFTRISHFKNYDTSILFKTVSTERIDLVSWYYDDTASKTRLDDNDKKFIGMHMNMVKDDPTKNKDGIVSNIK